MYEEVSIQQKGILTFEIHEIIVVCTSNSITTIFTIYFLQLFYMIDCKWLFIMFTLTLFGYTPL